MNDEGLADAAAASPLLYPDFTQEVASQAWLQYSRDGSGRPERSRAAMKIFLSSVIRGFEAYRDASARAARALRHEVKRAEDFAASSATPQQACLAGVRWAEAVILLLGVRYGDRQASGISPTHEGYREARERCPVLFFVERGALGPAPVW